MRSENIEVRKKQAINEKQMISIVKENGLDIPMIKNERDNIDYVQFYDILEKLGYKATSWSTFLDDDGRMREIYYERIKSE